MIRPRVVPAAIGRRWLATAALLHAVAVALALLFEWQRLAAKDRWPGAAELRKLAEGVCQGATAGAAVALVFASSHAVGRLRQQRQLEVLMAAGFGPGALRRCLLAMGLGAAALTAGMLLLASLLRAPGALPLQREGTAWTWWPAPPARPMAFDTAGLTVRALPRDAAPAAEVRFSPAWDLLAHAPLVGLLVVLAAQIALLARGNRLLFVHGVVLHAGALLMLLAMFDPGAALLAATAAVAALDRAFARRGLRRGT